MQVHGYAGKELIVQPGAGAENAASEAVYTGTAASGTTYDWRAEPTGLYLHVPFCESKCIYCDFNSYAHMESKFAPFVTAICADIERGSSNFLPGEQDCAGAEIATIFFGGGTPSVLQPEQISRILDAVRKRYNVAPDAEISMEANPGTITLEKFAGYHEAGVNRLSMGVQVLDDLMLKKLGRIHSAAGALESYRLAREAGFENINLDFIFGLPGQDVKHLDSMLDRLLAVSPLPEHLSCYSLIVEENTPLYTGVARGIIQVPDDDETALMYELVMARLPEAGYRQYEISNWTRARTCRHNLVYWHDQRYLAFGPGASGYWGNTRYKTVLAPADYIKRVRHDESVIAEQNLVSQSEEMGEFMMLGLRLNSGVSRHEFSRRFGKDIQSEFGAQLQRMFGYELLESFGDFIRLTPRGRMLGNEVFAEFI
ncbi:MAG: radical SAM family heme chaperone HemW [Chloroflexota bacterium]